MTAAISAVSSGSEDAVEAQPQSREAALHEVEDQQETKGIFIHGCEAVQRCAPTDILALEDEVLYAPGPFLLV